MSTLSFPTPTMSSREIAELVESRHDKVKQSMERLAERGLISFTPMGENSGDQGGRPGTVYLVNKRDSYVVVAQLSPEFTARLVDRWQELETQTARPALYESVQDPIPLTELRQRYAALHEEQAALDRRQAQVWQARADLAEAPVILTGEERQALGVTDERLLGAPAAGAPTQIAPATRVASAWPDRLNLSQRLAYGDMEKALFPDWFTPSELGESLGSSGRYFNLLLMEAGLQTKQGETWIPTPAARGRCRWFGTGKKHLKWLRDVLTRLNREAA